MLFERAGHHEYWTLAGGFLLRKHACQLGFSLGRAQVVGAKVAVAKPFTLCHGAGDPLGAHVYDVGQLYARQRLERFPEEPRTVSTEASTGRRAGMLPSPSDGRESLFMPTSGVWPTSGAWPPA